MISACGSALSTANRAKPLQQVGLLDRSCPRSSLELSTAQTVRAGLNTFSAASLVGACTAISAARAKSGKDKSRRTCRSAGMWPFSSKIDGKAIEKYFQNKVVWVTGASGGFGEAVCVELCRAAAIKGLVLSARNEDQLERVKQRCVDAGNGRIDANSLVVLPLDLSALDKLPAKAAEAQKSFGKIDVLVNNGGVGFRGVSWESSLDLDQEVMRVDYFSGVCLVKALLPSWMEARSGHVVQVASVQGFFGLPGRTAYAAAKHAALGFYDSLRAEVGDFGINVTTVCPGYIRTGHSANAVRTSSGYPEGHTNKGVDPVELALEMLTAVARQRPEFVSAAIDAQAARYLRVLCPSLLFAIMRKRARKERKSLPGAEELEPLGKAQPS
mmetsp:Transcript_25696/g.59914  ORF Transcript_25696/g.59914 Transcript_25696/m.59914 type:complete len:385 (-) Transcript_25696:47-1201(-)